MSLVYLVDDDPSVLRAVKRLLSSAGLDIKTYVDSQSFLSEHDAGAPGCVVLDVSMPGLSGTDLQLALLEAKHLQPVIFISGHSDVPISVAAMKAGAVDFLTKPFDELVLLTAVHQAISRDNERRVIELRQTEFKMRLATLTSREREVYCRMITGKLNKQTAGELFIVEKTVKVHRARVMKKMGVRSLAELVHLGDEFPHMNGFDKIDMAS